MTPSPGMIGGVGSITAADSGAGRAAIFAVRLTTFPGLPGMQAAATGPGGASNGPASGTAALPGSVISATGQAVTIRTPVGVVGLTLPEGASLKPGMRVSLMLPGGFPAITNPAGGTGDARLLVVFDQRSASAMRPAPALPASALPAPGGASPTAATGGMAGGPAPTQISGQSGMAPSTGNMGPQSTLLSSPPPPAPTPTTPPTTAPPTAAGSGAPSSGGATTQPGQTLSGGHMAGGQMAGGQMAGGQGWGTTQSQKPAQPMASSHRPAPAPTAATAAGVADPTADAAAHRSVNSRSALTPGLIGLLATARSMGPSGVASGAASPAIALPAAPLNGLSDLLAVLAGSSSSGPSGAQGLLSALPTPGNGLAGALAAVLGLFRSPGIRAAVGGDGLAALRRAGADTLINRALDGIRPRRSDGPPGLPGSASAGQTERGAGEWRHWVLPVLMGADLTPVHLYWRRDTSDGDDPAGENQGGSERFVVDLSLSGFGTTRVESRINRLRQTIAVVLATEVPLTLKMKRDLTLLTARTAEGHGLVGRLAVRQFSGADQ